MMQDEKGDQRRMGLRAWRETVAFLTLKELAERIGTTESAVSLWERGLRKPRIPMQRKIAEALGVKPWQIEWPAEGKLPAVA